MIHNNTILKVIINSKHYTIFIYSNSYTINSNSHTKLFLPLEWTDGEVGELEAKFPSHHNQLYQLSISVPH